MAGLDDLDRPAVDAVTVAGDDEALDRRREMILDRLGHRGGRLAGADHDRAAAARRGRQMGRDAGGGKGGCDGGVEEGAQQRWGGGDHGAAMPAASGSVVNVNSSSRRFDGGDPPQSSFKSVADPLDQMGMTSIDRKRTRLNSSN